MDKNGCTKIPVRVELTEEEKKKKEEEEEMEEFLLKLEVSLTELVSIISEDKDKDKDKDGDRDRVHIYVTLKPPVSFPVESVETLHKIFGVPDLDGHDIRDLYLHGELHAFGWSYCFGEDGLSRVNDQNSWTEEKIKSLTMSLADQLTLLDKHASKTTKDKKLATHFAGYTTKTEQEFLGWLVKNRKKYRACAYSAGDHNCLHFTRDALTFLEVPTPRAVQTILNWITNKGREFLNRMWRHSGQAVPGVSGSRSKVTGSGKNVLGLSRGAKELVSMKFEKTVLGSLSSSSADSGSGSAENQEKGNPPSPSSCYLS